MPVATVSKSTVAKPARKTRTRKAPAKKPAAIRTLKSVKRPSAAKLITPQRYLSDIKTRWAIHSYEIEMLVSDLKKGFNFVTPYHAEAVKTVKKWTV